MDYWKQELFKTYLDEFSNFYEDPINGYFQSGNLPCKLNKKERVLLNTSINLPKLVGCERNMVLNELLKDQSKDSFTFYLIRTLELECEVNAFDNTKKTVFIEIAERYFESEILSAPYLIIKLFERGYKIKEEDIQFVLELYKNIQKQNDFDKWSILRFATKLDDKNKFETAITHTRELFSILSFKLGKPIHFNFSNLLGVAINAISHYRESGDLILKSIDKFGRTGLINELDKRKGTFQRKRLEYLENRPIQNKEFEEIAIELIPELK